MGKLDITTSFDIDMVFIDAACEDIFEPSELRINLTLEHICGNEDDSISVVDQMPLFILEKTNDNQDHYIYNAETNFIF